MKNFLSVLAANMVLSKGPQDFPCSMVLMRLCLLVYFVTGLPGLMATAPFDKSLLAMALDTGVLLLFVYLCLQAFGKSARYIQTVTALAIVGAVFQLAVLPILSGFQPEETAPEALLSLSLLLLVFVSWNLAVYAHIFRESFAIRLPAAMLLTVCYVIITVLVRKLFFPELA